MKVSEQAVYELCKANKFSTPHCMTDLLMAHTKNMNRGEKRAVQKISPQTMNEICSSFMLLGSCFTVNALNQLQEKKNILEKQAKKLQKKAEKNNA